MADPSLPVTFVSSHAQLGGSELALETLLASLEDGWCAGVISLQDGPLVDRLRAAGQRVVVMSTGASALAIAGTARRIGPMLRDARLIHANGVKAALVCAVARTSTRRPVSLVWNKHDFSFDGRVGRAVARRCTCVVGVSNAVLKALGTAADTAVIPPAIVLPSEPPSPRPFLRRLLGVPDEAPVLALVGRLDVAKGHLHLLEALPRLVEAIPGLIVAFIGGEEPSQPHFRRDLMARAGALGVRDRIHLTGHRADAQRLIAGADAVAVLSHPVKPNGMGQEGFGLVALEALTLGTPVIAYEAGGLPEVVGDAAVLIPIGDREQLIRGVVDVLGDGGTASALVARGRKRAERFRLDMTARRWRELYTEYGRREPR